MANLFYLMLGGAVGTAFRYIISGIAYRQFGETFPWGTFAVNMIGSFLIGFLWALFEQSHLSSTLRTLIFMGILGGFTTFSTYTLESFNLFRDGEIKLAMLNIIISNFLGIIVVFLGFVCARVLMEIILE